MKKSQEKDSKKVSETRHIQNDNKCEQQIKTFKDAEKEIKSLNQKMLKAAENLDFEKAAKLRDQMKALEKKMLTL